MLPFAATRRKIGPVKDHILSHKITCSLDRASLLSTLPTLVDGARWPPDPRYEVKSLIA
jgi:hypothetical protein